MNPFRRSSALLVFFVMLFAFAAVMVGATSIGNGGAAGSWGNFGSTTAWGNGRPVFTPAPSPTPTPAPSSAPSVLYVQTFAQADPATTPAASITVTLGTSGTGAVAPLTANDLVAIIQSSGDGDNPHFAAPASPWVAMPGGSLDTLSVGGESAIDVFRLPAGNAKPGSLTLSTVTGSVVEAQATIVEIANAASFEVIASGGVKASKSSGYVSTTGTGTAAMAEALPIVAANLEDYGPSNTPPSGYTQLSSGQFLGDGALAYALDSYVGYGALLGSTTVTSSSVSWLGESGTVQLAGMKVLAEPGTGASPTPSPSPSPSPSPTPTATPTGLALLQTSPVVVPTSGYVTSVTPVLAATPLPNDLLEACVLAGSGQTVTPPAGWSIVASQADPGNSLFAFWRYAATSSPTSFTFTTSPANSMYADIREYTGVNLTTPFAGTGSASMSSTQMVPASITVTPTVAGTLPTSCFGTNSSMGVTAHTSGATEDFTAYASTANGNGYVSPWNGGEGQTGPIQSGTAAYTMTATWNITSGNGPIGEATLGMLAPQGVVVPTPSPSPSPSPGPTGTFTNGVDPPASFVPYGSTSPWNLPVCNTANSNCGSHPTYASYSSSVIPVEFGSGLTSGNAPAVWSEEAGQYDFFHPIFYASSSDPVINLACNQYCGGTFPSTMHIPPAARPAEGGDAHIAVIQPDGTEIDAWAAYGTPGRNWTAGDTLTAGTVASCGNYYTGTGWGPVSGAPYATVGSTCLGGGLIRPNELLAGVINHALDLILYCGVGGAVYPDVNTGQNPDNICTSGTGVPLGARLWYDVPDATTNANGSLAGWEKTILNALHDFGGYFMDTVNGASNNYGFAVQMSSAEIGFDYGGSRSSWGAPLAALGWTGSTIPNVQPGVSATRWIGSGGWLPAISSPTTHYHWLAPCSAQNTC